MCSNGSELDELKISFEVYSTAPGKILQWSVLEIDIKINEVATWPPAFGVLGGRFLLELLIVFWLAV